MIMADTTPLRRTTTSNEKDNALHDIETNDPQKIYMIHSNDMYGNHEYTDLALLLKKRPLG